MPNPKRNGKTPCIYIGGAKIRGILRIAALNQPSNPVNQPVSHSCIQLSNSIHLNTRALEIIAQGAFVETA